MVGKGDLKKVFQIKSRKIKGLARIGTNGTDFIYRTLKVVNMVEKYRISTIPTIFHILHEKSVPNVPLFQIPETKKERKIICF